MNREILNRTILFRGQLVDTKEWIFGDLIQLERDFTKVVEILDWSKVDNKKKSKTDLTVIPETVGQFVSKKNNVKIFEGDILKTGMGYGVVIYDNHYSSFMIDFKQHSEKKYFEAFLKFEKVGNIHDNPELLNASF